MADSLLFNDCKKEVYSNGMAVEPTKVQNSGYGCEDGVGQSAKYSSNAVTGHSGEPGIRGIGTESLRSRNCSVFDQWTLTRANDGKMLTSCLVRFRSGSNDLAEDGKRLDFRKKVKNANKAAVQNIRSVMEEKSIDLCIRMRMSGVIGNLATD